MEIEQSLLEKMETLSVLSLQEGETENLRQELSSMVDYFSQLEEVDVESVEPLSHPLELKNVDREDESEKTLPPEEALDNAPARDGNYFEVPRILNDEDHQTHDS